MTSTPAIQIINSLKKATAKELDTLLQWWSKRMVDDIQGGFYGRIDSYDVLHPKAPKSIILNTRILWSFAAAARTIQKPIYAQLADRAYQYILNHFWDNVYGGVYWMLDANGGVLNDKKQIYAQAFAIYAFSEYFLLSGQLQSKEKAIELFWLIERSSLDKINGGYVEAFTAEWDTIEDLRLSSKDLNAAKTMNTHLHLLEAYTNLYRIYPHEKLKRALTDLIDLFLTRFIDLKNAHLNLFFNYEWELLSHEVSYGHDIETSWLLVEAAEVLGDAHLIDKCKSIALPMVNATMDRGLDVDGSLFNEGTLEQVTDTDKHWWPQVEAMVGFLNAYQITKSERYLHAAVRIWDFTMRHLKDHENGEWHWMVNKDGVPILGQEDKAGPWKAPYHSCRACMECIQRDFFIR